MKKLILLISLIALMGCETEPVEPTGKVIFYAKTGVYTISSMSFKTFTVAMHATQPSCNSETTPSLHEGKYFYYVVELPLGKHNVMWAGLGGTHGEKSFTVRDIQCTILDCSQLNGWQ